eukprot:Trichotokara_eunicae@DN6400_c0_g1_i1.p1
MHLNHSLRDTSTPSNSNGGTVSSSSMANSVGALSGGGSKEMNNGGTTSGELRRSVSKLAKVPEDPFHYVHPEDFRPLFLPPPDGGDVSETAQGGKPALPMPAVYHHEFLEKQKNSAATLEMLRGVDPATFEKVLPMIRREFMTWVTTHGGVPEILTSE